MTVPAVYLTQFTRAEVAIVETWFRDPDTRQYLGGPEWPASMLGRAGQAGGMEFRGAIQTADYRYLTFAAGTPVGYIDCGTFDRCAVYGGEGQNGPIISETIDVATGSIAFVIDPQLLRRGLGRVMIIALLQRPELGSVKLFEAGVESADTASRRCLEAARFRVRSAEPDCEGMLYYRRWRGDPGRDAQ